jgi:5,10-methylenetetrahydromethanopterin reductase
MHERHFVGVNERDRPFVAQGLASPFSLTGTREQVRERLGQLDQGGATEVLFHAAGPDIERELRAFADAAGI